MMRRLKVIGAIASFIALFASLQVLWRPWLSPQATADYLVTADGKGLTAWVPDAARFWGAKIYVPLSERTEQFDKLRHFEELMTLLHILEADTSESAAAVSLKLLNSKSVGAQMLGLMAAKIHRIPIADERDREIQVIELLADQASRPPSGYDDTITELALGVVGKAKITGSIPVLRSFILTGARPYWTVIAACDALAMVPEKEAAVEILTEAVSQHRVVPITHCAQSLVKIAGSRAAPAIRQALLVETDPQEAHGLRRVLRQSLNADT